MPETTVPEDLKIYLLKLDDTDTEILKSCHDQMIGDDMSESLSNWLLALLMGEIPIYCMLGEEFTKGWPVILDKFCGPVIITGIYL